MSNLCKIGVEEPQYWDYSDHSALNRLTREEYWMSDTNSEQVWTWTIETDTKWGKNGCNIPIGSNNKILLKNHMKADLEIFCPVD